MWLKIITRSALDHIHIDEYEMIDILHVYSPGAFTCIPPLVDEDCKGGFRGNRGSPPPPPFKVVPPPFF